MATIAPPVVKIPNYINGNWIHSQATEWLDVTNPATGEIIGQTPLSDAAEVAAAVDAAAAACTAALDAVVAAVGTAAPRRTAAVAAAR